MSAGLPFVGKLADRVGSARVMFWAATGTIMLGVPLFTLLNQSPNLPTMIGIELVLGVLATAYFAPMPAIMSAMFPVQIRTTGLSLGYNIGVTVFGGFAPFIVTFLIGTTGSLLVRGYYLVAVAALSLCSIVVSRRVFQQR
jgi:MHS family proline/betaine transporter-like MFS transporter|nr:MFS transporter [Cryobacterium sp. Y11]